MPTVAESGVPGYAFDVWYGFVFPGGTPVAIVRKANAGVVKRLKSPEVSNRFAKVGVEPQTGTPEAFRDLIQREVVTWGKVVKAANIKVQ